MDDGRHNWEDDPQPPSRDALDRFLLSIDDALPLDYMSKPLQQAVRKYFEARFGTQFRDDCLYQPLMYLQPSNYITPLQQATDEYLLFFIETFSPYCKQHFFDKEMDKDGVPAVLLKRNGLIPEQMYLMIVKHIGGSYAGVNVQQRYKRGMLRGGVIRLLEITLRALMDELQKLMARGAAYDEFELACRNSVYAVEFLFGSHRFRSERLEILLLRYLDELGFNAEVATGVEKATESYRAYRKRLIETLPGNELGKALGQLERRPSRVAPPAHVSFMARRFGDYFTTYDRIW
jgi:hypothetical protein